MKITHKIMFLSLTVFILFVIIPKNQTEIVAYSVTTEKINEKPTYDILTTGNNITSSGIIGSPKMFIDGYEKNLYSTQLPQGIMLIQIQTISDIAGVYAILERTGTGVRFNITFTQKGALWEGTIDLTRPRQTSSISIPLGQYDLSFFITDTSGSIKNETYSNFVTISDTLEKPPVEFDQFIPYIIGAAVIIGVLAIGFMKKKKVSYPVESDLKMEQGTGQRKRGKIYTGASSIGKKSGEDAERVASGSGKVDMDTLLNQEIDSTIKSSKSIDKLIIDDQVTSSQIKPISKPVIKNETINSIDVTNKRINLIDQNMILINSLLSQSRKNTDQQQKKCETCGQVIPVSWDQCAFCVISEHTEDLKLNNINQNIPKGVSECPICKKILSPNWNKCPYCLLNIH